MNSVNKINLFNNFLFSAMIVAIIGVVNILYPILIGLLQIPEITGDFSILINWTSFVSIPIVNGIAPAISRFIAANSISNKDEIIKTGLKISIFYTIFAIVFVPIIGIFVFSLSLLDIMIITLLLLGMLFHYLFRHSLQGQENFSDLFIIELISFIVFIISTVLFVILPYFLGWKMAENFYLLFLPMILFHLTFNIFYAIKYYKNIKLDNIIRFPNVTKNILKYTLFVGLGSLFSLGINQIQIIISDLYLNDFEVGVLGFWSSAIAPITLLSIVISSIIVPRVTNLSRENTNLVNSFINKLNWALMLIILPIFALIFVLITCYPSILDFISLSKYQMNIYWLIPILLCFQIINSLLTVPTICYFSSNEEHVKYNPIISLIYAISVIVSWIILVPKLGIFGFATGIAIGAFIYGISVQILAFFISSKDIGKHVLVLVFAYLLIALSIFLLNYIPNLILIIIWSVLVLPSTYFGIRMIITIIKNEDYSSSPIEETIDEE